MTQDLSKEIESYREICRPLVGAVTTRRKLTAYLMTGTCGEAPRPSPVRPFLYGGPTGGPLRCAVARPTPRASSTAGEMKLRALPVRISHGRCCLLHHAVPPVPLNSSQRRKI